MQDGDARVGGGEQNFPTLQRRGSGRPRPPVSYAYDNIFVTFILTFKILASSLKKETLPREGRHLTEKSMQGGECSNIPFFMQHCETSFMIPNMNFYGLNTKLLIEIETRIIYFVSTLDKGL